MFTKRHAESADAPREPRVLLVEDEILIRMPIAEHLRGCGYHVTEASTAEEAQLIMTTDDEPDVVLSDINMPGALSGTDLAKWIHERFPKVKIILTSGQARFEKYASDLCEAHKFLLKPYSVELAESNIRHLLNSNK